MRIKSILAVVLALVMLAAGAFLPRIVGSRLDSQNENTVLFAAVDSVQLEFVQSDITVGQILAMTVSPRELVDVPKELATLDENQVRRIAAAVVERYREATFFPETNPAELNILYSYTTLYYGLEGQSAVYWFLGFGDQEGKQLYQMIIHDRTGIVCSIHYEAYDSQYHVEAMPEVLRIFCDNYLTGLGESFLDYDTASLLANAQSPKDRSYLATELRWQDTLYGEKTVTFFINQHGFYTYFS